MAIDFELTRALELSAKLESQIAKKDAADAVFAPVSDPLLKILKGYAYVLATNKEAAREAKPLVTEAALLLDEFADCRVFYTRYVPLQEPSRIPYLFMLCTGRLRKARMAVRWLQSLSCRFDFVFRSLEALIEKHTNQN
jgi:hypothetical protein